MKDKIKLIYLLGAGRSGTTLLATLLNAQENIVSVGEMHQFLAYLKNNERCSCGVDLEKCVFWGRVCSQLPESFKNEREYSDKKEKHQNIPVLMLKNKTDGRYLQVHEKVLQEIYRCENNKIILDSSKYIARYLRLSKSKQISIKGIYIVRDIRGVVNSFQKNVQTYKSPFSTMVYYFLVNFFAQLLFLRNYDILKVRYEDIVRDPKGQLIKIQEHLFDGAVTKINPPTEIQVPHIIGGNRMKKQKKISITPDFEWKKNMARYKQLFYYFAMWPLMAINRYKP